MSPDQSLIFAMLIAVGGVLLLRAVLWRFVCGIALLGPRVLRYTVGWTAWARGRSVLAFLKGGHARTYELLAARLTPLSFIGLPLTLTCLAALYAAALLGGLIDDLRETEGLVRLDQAVNAFFTPYRTPSLIDTFNWITALGAGPAITGMATVASALLWSQGMARLLLPLWITFLGAQGTTWAGKYAIGRARPAILDAVTATTPSFPSGHATASTALIGFLAYVIARRLPGIRARYEVVFWSTAIIGLICFSRIFLSLHYLSDVAAGLLVGVFWLLVGFSVAEFVRRPAA